MGIEVVIDKPAEFYDEVKQLIGVHYKSTHPPTPGSFAKNYPVVYELYLRIAALGLRKKDKPE